ncbi:MAG: glycosyltransferase family 2 protein [Selenomonadaceae bacterium]
MNKIVAVAMVKNEADIIESFARHALTFADALIVADHHSTDETRAILHKLADEGMNIEVTVYDGEGHDQSEVVTRLVHRAISVYGADVIVPLDADEFIVSTTDRSVRETLGEISSDHVYFIPWVDYALVSPETDKDKFILARPALRHRNAKHLPKIIVGAGAATRQHLIIQQGNHSAISSDAANDTGEVGDNVMLRLDGIHSAHFPRRSEAQQSSKNLCMWLSNMVRYSPYSFYSQDYHQRFYDFLDGIAPQYDDDSAELVPSDLDRYAGECVLRYTTGDVNPVKNALMMAESIAATCARERLTKERPRITVLMIYDGNMSAFGASLTSVLRQTYLPSQIIVLAFDNSRDDELRDFINHAKQESFDNGSDAVSFDILSENIFSSLESIAVGEFVQWVEPGIVLAPEKLADMALTLSCHEWCNIALAKLDMTGVTYPKRLFPGVLDVETTHPADYFRGVDMARELLATGLWPDFTLSSALFRRSVMTARGWLEADFIAERPLIFSLWVDIFTHESQQIALMANVYQKGHRFLEILEEAKKRPAEEFITTELEWGYLLTTNHDAEWLGRDAYDEGLRNFLTRRRASLERVSKLVPADMASEYAAMFE